MRILFLSRILLPSLFFMMSVWCGAPGLRNALHHSIEHWARDFGRRMFEVTQKVTAIEKLRRNYLNRAFGVKKVRGEKMVKDMAKKMADMLQKKVIAVQKLAVAAEADKANFKDTDYPDIDYDYFNAKKLMRDTVAAGLVTNANKSVIRHKYKVIGLEESSHFNNIPVNFTVSTVHVPTNVFDKARDVVDGIAWTTAIDRQFAENTKKDPTLTWQYFGSSTGFFRIYPGMIWPRGPNVGVDMFDCRVRGWYIQAATFPKDMVILLDASGSMHGLRMAIARKTVEKILDTLSDNDFFNIISFNKTPIYLDPCLNRTLVQANADNRRRLGEAIANIKTKYVANFEKALVEAFELFEHTKNQSKGTGCYTNKVIMLITDGAPENYEWVFKKYNWGKNRTVSVRVFTYLIGREVSHSRQVRWMACVNKGDHTHIATLADVQENVQKYVQVLSGPMATKRNRKPRFHTVWTNLYEGAMKYIKVLSRPSVLEADSNVAWSPVYLDYLQSLDKSPKLEKSINTNEGLQLMTSVAQPVFDRTDKTLLGVVGTDVAITELTNLTPKYKLGVNGYSFAVTSNGYVLFHPELRPVKWKKTKPNYNSVVLTEVELGEQAQELKISMINREKGSYCMKSPVHFSDMQRITMRDTNYFFAPIGVKNIPFSLAIALPKGYGEAYLNATSDITDISLQDLYWGGVEVAPWPYCENTHIKPQSGRCIDNLRKFLEMGLQKNKTYKEKCDTAMVGSLMFDASVTRDIHRYWTADGRGERCSYADGWCSVNHLERHGVELVFLGTRGGLTRYMRTIANVSNMSDPYFIQENTKSLGDQYYKRAADIGNGSIIFSVPIIDMEDTSSYDESYSPNKTMVTASTPLVLQKGKSSTSTVVAVLGYQMKWTSFHDEFLKIAGRCPNAKSSSGRSSSCDYTCSSPEVDCYLVDNNGFVVFAENITDVGMFFGVIASYVFSDMVKAKIFESLHVTDWQASCEVDKPSTETSSPANTLTTPFKWMYSLLAWSLQEFAFLIAKWGLLTWYTETHSVEANYETDSTDYQSEYPDEEGMVNTAGFEPNELALAQWYKHLSDYGASTHNRCLRNKLNMMIGTTGQTEKIEKLCTRNYTLYNANFSGLPHFKSLKENCGVCLNKTVETGICEDELEGACQEICLEKAHPCTKHYAVEHVKHTNLLLVAIDSTCQCAHNDTQNLNPTESFDDEEDLCYNLKESHHRHTKDTKQACPKALLVDHGKKCGASTTTTSNHFIILMTVLVLFSSSRLTSC